MTIPSVNDQLASAAWMFAKASVLLGVAAIGSLLCGRRSAAMRHLVWTCTVAGLLALPWLSAALPAWQVAIRMPITNTKSVMPIASSVEAGRTAQVVRVIDVTPGAPSDATTEYPQNAGTASDRSWTTALSGLYVVGVLLLLLRLATQRWTVQQIARSAVDVRDPEWQGLLLECAHSMGVHRHVRLLKSREHAMPMAFGTRRPAILIPAVSEAWSEDRRRAVLLHELAHVARHDCLTQVLAAVACAFYWIHPGVWSVARRLRVESEMACDDRVLTVGTYARDYAGHLLELAYTLGGHRAPTLVVSMARPGQLEGRLLAVLDAGRNRTTPGTVVRLAGVAITLVLLLPIAGVEATPATTGGDAGLVASSQPATTTQSAAAQARVAFLGVGTWEIRPSKTAASVYLRLTEGDSSRGSTWPIDRLDDFSSAQLSGAGGPVHFTSRRDAGTFTFEGIIRSGVGAGVYAFSPNPAFSAELSKRGLGKLTSDDQYRLAVGDIGFAFLDELTTQGYRGFDVAQLVRAADHGAQVEYLRGMGGLGYRLGTLDALIEQRDHGVGPEFIRALADQGLKGLSASDLLRARDHGVSQEYVQQLRDLGYPSLQLDQLVMARDHGVSAQYVRDLRDLGYKFSMTELTTARDHGVSAEYIRDLVTLRYRNLTLDSLVRLRDHGVSPPYVKELNGLGYDHLSIDDLVGLRDHGLSADRVRLANSRAGKHLSIELLKAAAAQGIR